MKIYSQPMTKALSLNLSAAICREPVPTSETPVTPTGDEAVKAPMF